MGKKYRLSPETAGQLVGIEDRYRKILILFAWLVLFFQCVVSGLLSLADSFSSTSLIINSLMIFGLIIVYTIRGTFYLHNHYFSYEVEVTEDTIKFRQAGKRAVDIRRDEVVQIHEILPEGEIYIKGGKPGQVINIYALVSKENPGIKSELATWKDFKTSSISLPKFLVPLTGLCLAFSAPVLLVLGAIFPDYIPLVLFFGGLSLVILFLERQWPAREKRIKDVLLIILVPALISLPLFLFDLFWLSYWAIGSWIGAY